MTTFNFQTKNSTTFTFETESKENDDLLLETGFALLLEDGISRLLLESSVPYDTVWTNQTKN